MNYSTAVFLINPEVVALRAVYNDHADKLGSKRELFKTFDKTIKVDDILVIPTSEDHRIGFTTVKVTEVNVAVDFDSSEVARWVVSKADVNGYKELLKMEAEANDKIRSAESAKRKADLLKTMFTDHEAEIANLRMAQMHATIAPATSTEESSG